MKKSSRILAFVLTLLMVVSLMPVSALAEELAPVSAAQSLLFPGVVEIPTIEEISEESETPAQTEEPEATETPTEETEEPEATETPTEATEQPEATETPVEETEETEATETLVEETEEAAEEEEVAEDGATTFVAAASFASDIHGSTDDAESVYSGVATSGLTFDVVGFLGDTFTDTSSSKSTVTSVVTSALGDYAADAMEVLYSFGDHDSKSDIADYTGLLYGDGEGEEFYVYAISMESMDDDSDISADDVAADLEAFTSNVATYDKSKPMFIMSHMPLHARRGDNIYAYQWYEVINAAAQTMDITFFWAHNHTSESTADTNAYYIAKGGTLNVEQGSSSVSTYAGPGSSSSANGTDVEIAFTYMNAGYINANNQDPARIGVATTVAIYEDELVFQDYNSSGTYTGTYAHNVSVTRSYNTSASKTFEYITVTEPACLMFKTGETFTYDDMVVKATYSDSSIETITDYSITSPDMSTPGVKNVTVSYSDDEYTFQIVVADEIALTDVEFSQLSGIEDIYDVPVIITYTAAGVSALSMDFEVSGTMATVWDTVSYSDERVDISEDDTTVTLTATDDYGRASRIYTFSDGTLTEYEEAGKTVSAITVSGTNVYTVGDELALTVTAAYSDDSTADVTENATITGYDMTTAGTYTVTATYGDLSATYAITVDGAEVLTDTENNTGVEVSVHNGIISAIEATASKNEYVATVATNKSLDNYAAYDITVTGKLEDGNYATVSLPVGEGWNTANLVAYYVSDDGATVEKCEGEYADGYYTFRVSHFSTYLLGDTTEITVPENATATDSKTTTTTTTTTKTVYVLTSSISSNNSYLIADSASAGDVHLVANDDGDLSNTTSTVIYGDCDDDGDSEYYIELTDATDELWTVGSSSTSLKNGSYYLTYSGSKGNYSLDLSTSSTSWNYSSNTLSIVPNKTTYYLVYDSGWDMSSSSDNVYFYVPTEIEEETETTITTSGTYSIEGEDISVPVSAGSTYNLTSNLIFTPDANNTATVESPVDVSTSATYEIVTVDANDNTVDGDPNDILVTDDDGNLVVTDGVVTFTGVYGTALVKVSYTTEFGVVTDYITITAVAPTYAVAITDPKASQLKISATQTLVATATMNDTAIEGATITWTTSDDTIATVDENGVVTGVATGSVTITATYTDPNGTVHTDTVNLEVVDAVYALDLCEEEAVYTAVEITEFATGVTYYTEQDGVYSVAETYDSDTTYYVLTSSVTKPIVVKDVIELIEAGTNTYNLWAVITKDGTDIGALSDEDLAKLTFISSNTAIATVNSSTGVVTYQGGEGLVTITAIYTYADGKSVTDTVVFSISKEHYYIPEDGTNDFPTYPEEGAIRFDKTATAVGNFSKTGITKVELSMTGVPYTTGNELDVVLMIDLTGSMYSNGSNNPNGTTTSAIDRVTPTATAAQAFVDSIVKNTDGSFNDNRIGVYVFHVTKNSGGGGDDNSNSSTGTTETIMDLGVVTKDNYDTLMENLSASSLQEMVVSGGTPYDTALEKCASVLETARSATNYSRSQYCVFMTDGCPTSYKGTSTSFTSASGIQGMFTDTNYDTRDTDYEYEYYSTLMKANGVTIYTVGLGLNNTNGAWSGVTATGCYNAASILLNDISGPANESANDAGSALNKMYTGTDYTDIDKKYFFSVDDDNADKMSTVFSSIAQKILDAAKDVKVTDKISDDFTMVFEAPNTIVGEADGNQEYYIEVINYTLTPVYNSAGTITNYVRSTGSSLLKLYLGSGTDTDGNVTYYAASDSSGTAYASPVFGTTAIGTKYYWTTDTTLADTYTDEDGETQYSASVTVDSTTYYFTAEGDGTHNMTSGAYAYGTPTMETITIKDTNGNESTTTNTTCENLIIATPYFVYNASTRMLIWTAEKLNSSELALSYFLYLEESGGYSGAENETKPGTYETNDYAHLTYTNFNGNECEQTFPVPQVTWNGAQVSYVFYLVNENGEPVNRAGKVIPFSEAVYVTDTYTYSIIWNDFEQLAELDAQYLAEDLVPDVYGLYDDDATYDIHVFENEEGENLNNHFVIGGDTETTYVFNTKADVTKYYKPGAYAASTSYKCKDYNVTVEDGAYKYNGTDTQVTDSNGDFLYDVDEEGNVYAIIQKTDGTAVHDGFDFANTTVAFAVVWKPELVPDTVVIDFGLPVVIDVATNDALAAGVVGVRADAPSGITMNSGQYAAAKAVTAELTHGTATMESLTSVRYTPETMTMNSPDVFYYESDVNYYTDGTNLTTTSMYSSVTVIPATTIYYEDSFVQLADGAGVVKTETTGTWSQITDSTKNTAQDQDRPGPSKLAELLDADNVYGYDKAYADSSTYSFGSSQKVTVAKLASWTEGTDAWPTATFTFTGTAFDIISLTSNTTGTITVDVYAGTDTTTDAAYKWVVDTYYGYTCEQNGYIEYTWIYGADGKWHLDSQTVAEDNKTSESMPTDPNVGTTFKTYEVNYEWTATENTPASLYQIPVIKSPEMTYGTYTVVITPKYASFFDHTGNSQYDFYLDAIRIYNPTGNLNDTANKAYIADGEGWPVYTEIRDKLLIEESFVTATLDTEAITGAVFIDGMGECAKVAEYEEFGPNNEVYLKPNQAVAFQIVDTNETLIAMTQLAYKALNGAPATITISRVDSSTGKVLASAKLTTSTATDMYNDISSVLLTEVTETDADTGEKVTYNTIADGIIIIQNTGDNLVSLTNLKTTYISAPLAETGFSLRMSRANAEVATAYVAAATTDAMVEENTDTSTGDDVTDDTTGSDDTTGDDAVTDEEGTPGDDDTAGDDTTGDDTGSDDTTEEEDDTTSIVESIINTVKTVIQNIRKILSGLLRRVGR